MTIQKQYLTWQRCFIGSRVGTDVSANINNNWNYEGREITCTELSFGNVETDKRLLAIVQYDDADYEVEVIDKMYASTAPWLGTKVTADEALVLCNDWYPAPEGVEAYFTLAADGFTLVDGRPEEPL